MAALMAIPRNKNGRTRLAFTISPPKYRRTPAGRPAPALREAACVCAVWPPRGGREDGRRFELRERAGLKSSPVSATRAAHWKRSTAWLFWVVLHQPELALVRGDPRVKVLRKKIGLPE